jgi:hypothetical protein
MVFIINQYVVLILDGKQTEKKQTYFVIFTARDLQNRYLVGFKYSLSIKFPLYNRGIDNIAGSLCILFFFTYQFRESYKNRP